MTDKDPKGLTMFDRVMAARAVIVASGAKPGSSGTVVCPHCKGTIKWSMASNGHIWAACSTPDCVHWIE